MPSSEDYIAAKQALSDRLLRTRLNMGAAAPLLAMTVAGAVENASANVHAVGIGLKVVNGVLTDTKCIRVHLTQKIALSLVKPQDRIPEEIDGVPTDVVVAMPATILARRANSNNGKRRKPPKAEATAAARPTALQTRTRPVFPGLSVGHFQITAGTIACFCYSTKAGDDPDALYVLSNNHVLANVNMGQHGDAIYQQGPIDGGQAADTIANLERFVPLVLGGQVRNRVDAAIGRLMDVAVDTSVNGIGKIEGVGSATDRMKVRKTGRTTGYTEGVVTDLEYDAVVGMSHEDPSIQAVFERQVRIEPVAPFQAIGLAGDSGSLVMDEASQTAVGLYFAGPPGGEYGVANPIADVLTSLDIAIE